MSLHFLRFLAMGGVAAIVNLSSRYMLNWFMPFELAVLLAYLAGMATAYTLFARYVFGASGRPISSEVRRFALVNMVSATIVWVVSVGLARVVFPWIGFTWHANTVAHLVGVAAPAVASYFGHREFTFRKAR